MINQNEIEEAANKHDDETNVHDGYHDFKSGANWAITLLKERSGKGFKEFCEANELASTNADYVSLGEAATLSVEARHSEELKKLEDRIEKLREALLLCAEKWNDRTYYSAGKALALDDQLKEGKA